MARYIGFPLRVFRDPSGNWIFHPMPSATYDAELAEQIGHDDAAAGALEECADTLMELAAALRSHEIEIEVCNEEIDSDNPEDDWYE